MQGHTACIPQLKAARAVPSGETQPPGQRDRIGPGTRPAGLLTLCLVTLCLLGGCSTLPDNLPKTTSQVIPDGAATALGRAVATDLDGHPGRSGFHPLGSGIDAFVARVALVDAAERSLDIQYYIWHADETGVILMQRILAAADRGVRVRLLLDDLDTAGKSLAIERLDSHPNIEIRLFNPFVHRDARAVDFVTDLSRVNRRMHNKSLTADNQATIVGGRNVGNEYFEAEGETVFADMDVLCVGPIVASVSSAFDEYWNSDWAVPAAWFTGGEPASGERDQLRDRLKAYVEAQKESAYAKALREAPLTQAVRQGELRFAWGEAVLVYDAPEKMESSEISDVTHVGPRLHAIIDQAQQELIVISPYFVPGWPVVDYFGQLVSRGVRVRILTNALAASDVSIVHAGYMRYRKRLLEHGVELYEFKPDPRQQQRESVAGHSGSSGSSLHAKVFGIDREQLFVGSFNLDPRSVSLNTEMGVWFKSEPLGKLLGEGFDREMEQVAYRLVLQDGELRWHSRENGQDVIYDHEPETGWWRRFSTWMLSLVVVEAWL